MEPRPYCERLSLEKKGSTTLDLSGGNVLFINNLEGCKDDVRQLSNKFMNMGYNVKIFHKSPSFQELEQKIQHMKSGVPSNVIVFFFGYGFGNSIRTFMFLNEDDKECLSSREFCKLFTFEQKKNESVVVFLQLLLNSFLDK